MSSLHCITDYRNFLPGWKVITTSQILQDVRISGMIRIPVPLECFDLRISGSVHAAILILVHGKLTNSGLFEGVGDIAVESEMHCSGSTRVHGNFHVF